MKYFYLFNVIFSVIVGILSYNKVNIYVSISCIGAFLFSLFCLIASFNDGKRKHKNSHGSKNHKNHILDDISIDYSEATSPSPKISKLTKVLIHKTHGGRKRDSKFWNDQIDLEKSNNRKIKIKSKNTGKSNVLLVIISVFFSTVLVSGCLLFILYPNIFKPTKIIINPGNSFSSEIIKPNNSLSGAGSNNKKYTNKPKTKRSLKDNDNNVISSTFPVTSVTGKVFSWIDDQGKRHFSNTTYPANNDTLKVEDEINSYQKVTKFSIEGNQIYLPVTLSNKGKKLKINMLLDTGCSRSSVPYKYLKKINPDYFKKVTFVLADGRKTSGKLTIIDSIKVGSKQQKGFTVAGSKVVGSSNRGLLGMDFLKLHQFKIDMKNQFIVWM